jgi:hypothetical protein
MFTPLHENENFFTFVWDFTYVIIKASDSGKFDEKQLIPGSLKNITKDKRITFANDLITLLTTKTEKEIIDQWDRTGTPYRLDEKGVRQFFEQVIKYIRDEAR